MEILKSQRQTAQKIWDDFENPEKNLVLVGAATCGRAAGALDIIDEFKRELSAAGLGDVEVVETACIGLCYAEPLVEVRAAGVPPILYSNVHAKDVSKIVSDHIKGG